MKTYLAKLVEGQSLSLDEMTEATRFIMTGKATDAQIGAFLMGLHQKGETTEEIMGAVRVMRSLSLPVSIQKMAIDTCGTGGDGANLFNVSTASAFVVAAAGGHVAKHGNRSVSSVTGSADLLECAGVNLAMTPDQIGRAIDDIGVGFMFAPVHHSAMKYAVGPRKDMSIRTLFNLIGPLSNPAGVKHQVVGVYDKTWCQPFAEVLHRLGSERVLVVSAADGLDEFSIASDTFVVELNHGKITSYTVTPESVGLERASLDGLTVGSAVDSLQLIQSVFKGVDEPVVNKASDLIALNAGAALYVLSLADTLKEGVSLAIDTIASGLPRAKLGDLAAFSRVCESVNA